MMPQATETRNPNNLLKVVLKHVFGLSDHTIQRVHHLIGNAGETANVRRAVTKIPANILHQLFFYINAIDDLSVNDTLGFNTEVEAPEDQDINNVDDDNDTEQLPDTIDDKKLESAFRDFKTVLMELTSVQQGAAVARAQGMGTRADRKVSGNMDDKSYAAKQAQEMNELEQSDDPIDRRILQLKRQLAILYRQKEAKKAQDTLTNKI